MLENQARAFNFIPLRKQHESKIQKTSYDLLLLQSEKLDGQASCSFASHKKTAQSRPLTPLIGNFFATVTIWREPSENFCNTLTGWYV